MAMGRHLARESHDRQAVSLILQQDLSPSRSLTENWHHSIWHLLAALMVLINLVLQTEVSVCRLFFSHLPVYSLSARALVKKTQEPGIKLQKADFFRNDTWTSPQTNSEEAPKIPLVHFS